MSEPKTSQRMPVLFVGHGSPMNAIEDNAWSKSFRALTAMLPNPRAILSISAHWYVSGICVTAGDKPKTIHDFGGFPKELYHVEYPAPGDPELAQRVVTLIGEDRALFSTDWGLDHGTWSVLRHVWPKADHPIVQLSVDSRLTPAQHLALGRVLSPLRDEGVLIFASGNIVHNLPHAMRAMRDEHSDTPDWAIRFDEQVAQALERHDEQALTGMLDTPDARLAQPTPDHYLPLLYAAGSASGDDVRFPITGFDLSSISMRAALFG